MSQYIPPNLHEDCDCQNMPRDVVDVVSPLYQACGGRVYRIHATTEAKYVQMGAGGDVETRINLLEKNLLANSRIYFADNLKARDAIPALTAGDCVYVSDASADPDVVKGPAMYLWLPLSEWRLLYKGFSPLDPYNLIARNGGLKVDEDNRLYVDFSGMSSQDKTIIIREIVSEGSGLVVDKDGKLTIATDQLAGSGLTSQGGKLALDPATAAGSGLTAQGGKLAVDPSQLAGSGLKNQGGKLTLDADAAAGPGLKASGDKLAVDPSQLAGSGLTAQSGRLVLDGAALAGNGLNWNGGKFEVDFAAMNDDSRAAIISSILASGGGLEVGPDGKIRFNPKNMDTTIFQNMMETLHLPVWLTAQTLFYVDKSHSAASDSLTKGRGLSASLPFKTPQAAAAYVASNYNVGSFGAIIDIAAGDYTDTGHLDLGTFANTTAAITIRGRGPDLTILPRITCRSTAPWRLESVRVKPVPEADYASARYLWAISTDGAGSTIGNLRDVTIDLSSMTAWTKSFYALCIYGSLRIDADNAASRNGISILSGGMKFSSVLHTSGGSIVNYADINILDNLNYGAFVTSSAMGRVSFLENSSASNPGRFPQINLNGHNCAGKRYSCATGGTISVNKAGPEYFPGSEAGTVDAATYAWYQ